MSDETKPMEPKDERDREWLCELLDDPQRAVDVVAGEDPQHEAGVRCEYLALLALMSEAVEPAPVPAGLEDRVLTAAGVAERRAAAAPRFRGPWLLPLAAAAAVAALTVAVWQTARVGELRAIVASQAEALDQAREVREALARMEGENAAQAEALALLTAAGAEFCPLRPPSASPTPRAYGALAMSPGGGPWYLRVVGLEPREDGEYRLWFFQDGNPVEGVALAVSASGGALEMLHDDAPELFNSVAITFEPAGSRRPSGPRLLFGNQRMTIL